MQQKSKVTIQSRSAALSSRADDAAPVDTATVRALDDPSAARRLRQRFAANAVNARGNAKRVLILTSGLGSGHVQVARAVALSIEGAAGVGPNHSRQEVEIATLDFWTLLNPSVAEWIRETYLSLVEQHPAWYDELYGMRRATWRPLLGAEVKPSLALRDACAWISSEIRVRQNGDAYGGRYPSDRWLLGWLVTSLLQDGIHGRGTHRRAGLLRWTWSRLARRLSAEIRRLQPDLLISTQLIPAALVSWCKQNYGLRAPSVGVLTDFGAHNFWIQPQTDHYCVPHSNVMNGLEGISEGRISVTGIPLMPAFSAPPAQHAARQQLGLPQDEPIAMVLGGGLGLRVAGLSARLLAHPRLQVLAMAGSNAAAERSLLALNSPRLHVYGWTDDMPLYLRAADFVVGKPGGVSLAESLTCGRPFFAVGALLGQEAFNQRFLETQRIGATLAEEQLLPHLAALLDEPNVLAQLQARAARAVGRDAAAQVASLAHSFLDRAALASGGAR